MAFREEGTVTLKLVAQDLMSGNVGKALAGLDKLAQKGGLVGSVAQGVGQSFGQMLNPIALATKGIGAITDVMGDSISAASDQAEALSKVTVVFGDQADAIKSWATTAASSMGMSETAALSAAGTLGNLFDSLDMAESATVDMSKGMVQLAADLGSFNNVPVEEALLAIRSGLLGEAEPMRKFGSALSAARVDAYGMAHGLETVKGKLTEAAKVQARYALMLEDTVNAQGDFFLTSKGLANSTKTFNANLADLSADLGKMLVGPAAGFVGFLNDVLDDGTNAEGAVASLAKKMREDLTPALEGAVKAAGTASGDQGAFGDLGDAVIGLTNLLQPHLAEYDEWATRTLALGDALGATRLDLVDLATAVKAAGGDFDDYRAQLFMLVADAEWVEAKRNARGVIVGSLNDLWRNDIIPVVKDGANDVSRIVRKLPERLHDGIVDGKSRVRDAMKELKWAMNHPMANQEYIAWLKGQATSKRLAKGLRSKKESIRLAAQETYRVIQTELILALERAGATLAGWNAGVHLATGTKIQRKQFRHRKGGGRDRAQLNEGAGGAEGRASGGPVAAGETYLVGEQGPELLHMGNQSGNITPNHRMGGVTIVYSPQVSTASPIEAQRFIRGILPQLRRELAGNPL